jgi:carbonic anhydrase/acetyltransferase-like protein (isoleucine patch superfamily)
VTARLPIRSKLAALLRRLWPVSRASLPQALLRTLDPAALLRRFGARVHPTARVGLRPVVTGAGTDLSALQIGAGAELESDCVLDLSGPLRIGERARIGALTRIVTEGTGCEVGAGAVVGPRAVLLAGVRLAADSRVEPTAVVQPEATSQAETAT